MVKIVTVEQMRSIEQAADASGLAYDQMMENAGRGVAEAILERIPNLRGKRVLILVGSGNNGGDGLVAGHYLTEAGAEVSAYLTKSRPEDDPNLSRLAEHGGLVAIANQDQRGRVLRNMVSNSDVIIDAVLGTGFKLPLEGAAKDLLGVVKKALEKLERIPYVAAVDCPSGLDCDLGATAEETLVCDLTISLAAAKPGLIRFPGADFVGELVVADIGIPDNQKEMASVELDLATMQLVKQWIPMRPRNAHKGTFGRALIAAGSINYPGAAALAGLGAYRVGAGLVTLAVPGSIQAMLVSHLPEATWIVLPHDFGVISEQAADVLSNELENSQALLLGPGFGQEPATLDFLRRLLDRDSRGAKHKIGFIPTQEKRDSEKTRMPPCVVDADGLKLLAQLENWEQLLPQGSILTPHPGEMSIMIGEPVKEIQADRVACAQKWAKVWGHVVVLKGAFTVVAAPESQTTVLPFATPALASAGTGDVLAGAIVGLRAQGVAAYHAAVLGAYLHGRAGEIAADILGSLAGVIAGDVADALPSALAELRLEGVA